MAGELNRSKIPGRPVQTVPPRPVPAFDPSGIEQQISALDQKKANASTVGGIVTALNSKASQSDLNTLAAQKADAAALQAKADTAAVAQALADKADATALASKADAATLAALSSTVSGKASTAALTSLAATVPTIATDMPQPEAVNPQPGVDGLKVLGAKHQHPRLSSTTAGTILANGTATVAFTRTFTLPPGMVITEIPGTAPPQTMPATFKVESWVREIMTPTPSGAYTGAVIRAWRSQVLPTQTTLSLVSLLTGVITGVNTLIASLTGFNVFGASVTGTAFSCIAIQRSDA
jgi:hypothetical protein